MTTAMAPIRLLLVLSALVLALALVQAPVRAAEVVYPPGSRIGLAPPPGLAPSRNFFGGYEDPDPDSNVVIKMAALPVEAYAELAKTMGAEALKRQGLTFESREAMPLSTGKAFLVIGHQEVDKTNVRKWFLVAASPGLTAFVTVQVPDAAKARYPDAAIRAALATLAVRTSVPIEEQLGLVPFKVGELAGFRVAGVVPGRAVVLSDAPAAGPPESAMHPHSLVAMAPGGPAQSSERDAFARDLFATIPILKEVRLENAEPLRIGGQQGHQILASGRDAASGAALTVAQWLRFGGGAYMQMVGIARSDAWKDAYPRFRSVRDGIEPR